MQPSESANARDALLRDLAAPQRSRPATADAAQLRQQLRERLGEWRGLLRSQVPQSRQMIRKLMRDRIVFTPEQDTRFYRYVIPGSLDRFFSGLAYPRMLVDAGGIEPPTS